VSLQALTRPEHDCFARHCLELASDECVIAALGFIDPELFGVWSTDGSRSSISTRAGAAFSLALNARASFSNSLKRVAMK